LRDFRPFFSFAVKETTMVGYRSGRQGEAWAEYTIPWTRKPRTHQERIEEWLGSSDLHDLLTAVEALEKQGPDASGLLRSIVQHDARKCREGKRQVRLGVALVALTAIAILCWNVTYPEIAGTGVGCLLLAIWLVSPCAISWYEDYRTHGKRLNNAVALLHRIPRSSAVVEMIEALDAGDSRTASLAAKSLIVLLPQITETEGVPIQAKHQVMLRRALRGYNSDLILAILQASDGILDLSAIPDVRWLTRCPDWFAESEKIQAAACRSLTALQADNGRRRSIKTLLRASLPPAAPAEELLRPAAGAPVGNAHQMLRAGSAAPSALPVERAD
jgi:hypothetical protein